ncbi:MAG: HNH endonuclease [Candidatus Gastranaerophilales bacterium]|nr:HNH endonuclease [Candidatus Gastranaerophilales bacterium]
MKILFNTLIAKNNINKDKKASNPLFFKGFDCPQDSFELKNLYNIPCPICSIPMIRRNQIDKFVASVQDKTGNDLIQELQKYQKYYHETEALAASDIILEAGKNTGENIKQIVDRLAQNNEAAQKDRILDEIDKMRRIANSLTQQEQKSYNIILDEYAACITHDEKTMSPDELCVKLLSVIKNQQNVRKRIEKTVKRLPSESEGSAKFFKRNMGKSQAEIASRLVTPSYITCEHIKPKSNGGANNTANYLAQCEDCNSKRNNKPFMEWINSFPLFPRNFRMYIDAILQKLENGELSSKYDSYLEDVTTTVAKETNGRVRIEAPKIKRAFEAVDGELSIEEYLSTFKAKLRMQKGELKSMKREASGYEINPQFHLIVEYNKMVRERTGLYRKLKEQEKTTSTKKDILDSCYKKINELSARRAKFAEMKPTDKQYNDARTQIRKIEAFLETKDIPEIETQYNEAKSKLEEIKGRLSRLNSDITNIEKKIDFPQQFQDIINEKKARLSDLTEKVKREKPAKISSQETMIKDIAQLEEELQLLIQANASLDTSASTGKEVVEYRHFLALLERTKTMKAANENPRTKTLPEDAEILELATQKIEENLDMLITHNPSVQYQRNLDKIADISATIQKAYENLERTREQSIQQKALLTKLEQYEAEITTLNTEIEELSKKLEETKKLFNAATSEFMISSLEDEIACKEKLLLNFELGNISEEDFLMEATSL